MIAVDTTTDWRAWYATRPAPGWRHRAACRGTNNATFFPGPGFRPQALNVCHSCVVTDDCLVYAFRTELPSFRHGIYGGTSANERERLGRLLQALDIPIGPDADDHAATGEHP
jgi:hypothetical protein